MFHKNPLKKDLCLEFVSNNFKKMFNVENNCNTQNDKNNANRFNSRFEHTYFSFKMNMLKQRIKKVIKFKLNIFKEKLLFLSRYNYMFFRINMKQMLL